MKSSYHSSLMAYTNLKFEGNFQIYSTYSSTYAYSFLN